MRIVLVLIVFLLNNISAQNVLSYENPRVFTSQSIKKEIYYNQLIDTNNIKYKSDFNINGKVKSIKEFILDTNDTFFLYFNKTGILTNQKDSRGLINYIFEESKLKSIVEVDKYISFRFIKFFDSTKYIKKEIRINNNNNLNDTTILIYFYNEKFDSLNIKYNYNIDTSQYDIVSEEYYKFNFNNNNDIINMRKVSKHKVNYYGSNTSYSYFLNSRNISSMHYLSDCFGSNSCGNYLTNYTYDKRNNLISIYSQDFTIRNSITFNSSYIAKFNNYNDPIYLLIEQIHLYYSELNLIKSKISTQNYDNFLKPMFKYQYDQNGNWIKKYKLIENNWKLISNRIIEYYIN